MKKLGLLSVVAICAAFQAQAADVKQEQFISKLEDRKSIVVNKTDFKKYFSGGEVRIDPVYPKKDAKTHSAAYVTFEPGARSNWHKHPAGQHIIVTKGVGYTQTWDGRKEIIKEGDVVWCPIDVKHWHGASKDIAMTHLVVTGAVAATGENVQWFEPVSDAQYNGK